MSCPFAVRVGRLLSVVPGPALLLVLLSPTASGAVSWRTGLEGDAVLEQLVADALAERPELAAVRARLEAERQRVPRAGALPDPTLSLGIQNDGFERLEIGHHETSYYAVMLSQALPFPGKLGQRSEVVEAEVDAFAAEVSRVELSTVAEVRRGYVALLLLRGELELLAKLEALWEQAERVAESRYEVGQGSQADLLRAQLERARLRQQRLALEAAEQSAIFNLNRLRNRPPDAPIGSPRPLEALAAPDLPSLGAALRDGEERSPELRAARAGVSAAARAESLARRELLPDLSLSAGVMPRGELPPMWQVSLGISLPVYAGSKQLRAIDESSARASGRTADEATVRQILELRTRERLTQLEAALRTNALYTGGVLVQSEATVSSTVAQYQVGKVPFTAVLEALRGYFADRSGYLASTARALELAIAQEELSLDPPAALGVSFGGASMGSQEMPVKARTGAAAPTAIPTAGAAAGMGSM